ncbi:MAG: GNAT family N-acetyltransferase [Cyanobacteria bacterium J06636_16]
MIDTDMRLRSATPQDEGKIHQLLCIPKVFEYLADGKEPPPDMASAWISSAAADHANYVGGLWVLVDEANLHIGGVVRLAGDDDGELELIYLLHPSFWGLGFATRMAHTVMKQAFEAGLVATIWAGADAPNKASLAVMKRLGMQFRREVQYPLGTGMEYQIKASEFDSGRIEPLPIA